MSEHHTVSAHKKTWWDCLPTQSMSIKFRLFIFNIKENHKRKNRTENSGIFCFVFYAVSHSANEWKTAWTIHHEYYDTRIQANTQKSKWNFVCECVCLLSLHMKWKFLIMWNMLHFSFQKFCISNTSPFLCDEYCVLRPYFHFRQSIK